jgi:hypothetical protein
MIGHNLSVADYATQSSASFVAAALNTYHAFTVRQIASLSN